MLKIWSQHTFITRKEYKRCSLYNENNIPHLIFWILGSKNHFKKIIANLEGIIAGKRRKLRIISRNMLLIKKNKV